MIPWYYLYTKKEENNKSTSGPEPQSNYWKKFTQEHVIYAQAITQFVEYVTIPICQLTASGQTLTPSTTQQQPSTNLNKWLVTCCHAHLSLQHKQHQSHWPSAQHEFMPCTIKLQFLQATAQYDAHHYATTKPNLAAALKWLMLCTSQLCSCKSSHVHTIQIHTLRWNILLLQWDETSTAPASDCYFVPCHLQHTHASPCVDAPAHPRRLIAMDNQIPSTPQLSSTHRHGVPPMHPNNREQWHYHGPQHRHCNQVWWVAQH